MLYNLLLSLEERKIYRALIGTGVIPFSVNTSYEIYKSYLQEIKTEKRKKQAAYNVSVTHRCSIVTVYTAINKMRQELVHCQEITFS